MEAQRVHELERGVDLAQLRSGDAHQPAEEAIVVFEVEGLLEGEKDITRARGCA